MSHNSPMPDDAPRDGANQDGAPPTGKAATGAAATACNLMRNEQAHADLKAFADGELPLARRIALSWHVRRCAACRKEMVIMEKISRELRAQDAPQAASLDSGLRARILASVSDAASMPAAPGAVVEAAPPEAAASPDAAPLTSLRRRPPVLAWGAAAVALLMLGTFTKTFIESMGGSRVQTVFNTANNSLSTSTTGDDEDYASDALAPDAIPAPLTSAPARRESAGDQLAKSSRQRALSAASSGSAEHEERASANRSFNSFNRGNSMFSDGNVKLNQASREKARQRMSGMSDAAQSGVSAGAAGVPMGGASGSGLDGLYPQRRVHKEAAIAVEVSELEAKSEAVEKMVKSVGGYVASNDLDTGGNGLRRANLLIKVPVARFESVLQSIAKLGLVKNKKVSGEDITVQVSDAEQSKTVLANQLEAQVQRFKKAKLKDKPQERHEARIIQIQLAQARARFNLLSRLAALSTLNVQLQEKEKPKPVAQSGFMNELDKTRHAATEAFFSAARVPVVLLMWALAYSPIWLPLLVLYRYASRFGLRRNP